MKNNLLILIFLFCGFQLTNAQTITYYAKFMASCNGSNMMPTSGFNVKVEFNGNNPTKIFHNRQWHNLIYEYTDGTVEMYSIDNPMFNFGINKNVVVEYYNNMGFCTVTGYNANADNSGGYQGGAIGGFNNGNSSSTYSTCRTCGGSGICTSCHGSGGEWRDTGYYTGSGSRTWISCPSCNGSKRCFNCHGTGRY